MIISAPLTSAVQRNEDMDLQIMIADWFASLLIAPPEALAITTYKSPEIRDFLIEIGDALEMADVSQRLVNSLQKNSTQELEHTLGYQYVFLFDGISGPNTAVPYESFYTNDNGRLYQKPFVEMQKIMSALDVSVGQKCREPNDHIALELATLAEALRQKNDQFIDLLYRKLANWVPMMSAAVHRVLPNSFYDDILVLLVGFLSFFHDSDNESSISNL